MRQGGEAISAESNIPDDAIPLEAGVFTAAEVETRSGIPAATLRQWERRYGLPNPQRSASGYRLYSRADLDSIEFIKARIAAGVPAGRAVQLLKDRIESDANDEDADNLSLAVPQEYARALTEAAIAGDGLRVQEVLAAAHSVLPLEAVLLQVVQASLVDVGERWHQGTISVAHEHRATSLLRARLHALLELTGRGRVGPTVVVACAPGERHELGSLILTIFLRRGGLNAHYLGADMPLDDLIKFSQEVHAQAVLISATTPGPLEALRKAGHQLKDAAPLVVFGGRAINEDPPLAERLGGSYLGADASQVLEALIGHFAGNR